MGKLVLKLPDGSALDIPLDRERVTIGRRPDNDVCLPYPAVSGEHAAVVTILDDSFLEDLNSTNGTLVNGKPVAKHFLRDGDEIDIGRQVLTYTGGAPAVETDDAPVRSGRTLRHPRARQRTGVVPDVPPLSPQELQEVSGNLAPAPDAQAEPPPVVEASTASPFAPPPGEALPLADLESLLGTPDSPAVLEARRRRASDLRAPPQEPAPVAAETVVDAHRPRVDVETGAGAGRSAAMIGDELVIGRVGVSIVALRRVGGGFRLVPLEGDAPVNVNGRTIPRDGADLVTGDAFEVAGARLRLVAPRQ